MKAFLSFLNFLCKGWEVSLLILLAFFQKEAHLSLFQVGILGMGMVVAQILTTLAMGTLTAFLDSRKLIAATLLFYGLAWLLLLNSLHFWMLLLVYTCGGIGSGIYEPLANSLAAQYSSAKKRSEGIGNVEAFGDLGRIGVSALTTWLIVLINPTILAGGYGLIALATFCISVFFVGNAAKQPIAHDTKSIFSFLKNSPFRLALFAGMLDSFASSSLYIFIPFLLTAKGIPLSSVGILMTLFFIGYLSGRLLLGRLADKHGIATFFIFSDIAMGLCTILLVLMPSTVLLYGVLFALGVFTRGTSPIVKAMVAETIAKKEHFDKGYSVYSFFSRSSSVVSRPFLGYVANMSGIAIAFYVATAIALIATIPAYYFKKER